MAFIVKFYSFPCIFLVFISHFFVEHFFLSVILFFTHFDFSEIIVAICILVVVYLFFRYGIMKIVCTWAFFGFFLVFFVCALLRVSRIDGWAESWDWWNWKDIRVNENNIKVVNVSCVYVKWIIKFEICYIIRNHCVPGTYSFMLCVCVACV